MEGLLLKEIHCPLSAYFALKPNTAIGLCHSTRRLSAKTLSFLLFRYELLTSLCQQFKLSSFVFKPLQKVIFFLHPAGISFWNSTWTSTHLFLTYLVCLKCKCVIWDLVCLIDYFGYYWFSWLLFICCLWCFIVELRKFLIKNECTLLKFIILISLTRNHQRFFRSACHVHVTFSF